MQNFHIKFGGRLAAGSSEAFLRIAASCSYDQGFFGYSVGFKFKGLAIVSRNDVPAVNTLTRPIEDKVINLI
jgi:hypothetical protein